MRKRIYIIIQSSVLVDARDINDESVVHGVLFSYMYTWISNLIGILFV